MINDTQHIARYHRLPKDVERMLTDHATRMATHDLIPITDKSDWCVQKKKKKKTVPAAIQNQVTEVQPCGGKHARASSSMWSEQRERVR